MSAPHGSAPDGYCVHARIEHPIQANPEHLECVVVGDYKERIDPGDLWIRKRQTKIERRRTRLLTARHEP